MKKTYYVYLEGVGAVLVQAQRYRRDGEQYVFESDGDPGAQFFYASKVIGIVVAPVLESFNLCEQDYRPSGPDLGGC